MFIFVFVLLFFWCLSSFFFILFCFSHFSFISFHLVTFDPPPPPASPDASESLGSTAAAAAAASSTAAAAASVDDAAAAGCGVETTTTTPQVRGSRFSILNDSQLSIDNSPRFINASFPLLVLVLMHFRSISGFSSFVSILLFIEKPDFVLVNALRSSGCPCVTLFIVWFW